eukprot:gene10741-biopygen9594
METPGAPTDAVHDVAEAPRGTHRCRARCDGGGAVRNVMGAPWAPACATLPTMLRMRPWRPLTPARCYGGAWGAHRRVRCCGMPADAVHDVMGTPGAPTDALHELWCMQGAR